MPFLLIQIGEGDLGELASLTCGHGLGRGSEIGAGPRLDFDKNQGVLFLGDDIDLSQRTPIVAFDDLVFQLFELGDG